ncbi:MAG: type II secretion system protein [Lachnospiraceae bacterium]|nr:type II secretion system protein [Lachnospiraceae bacterium]
MEQKVKANNKGFSLVELIVVVLIMAIIAVALAPQVMKWVDNSRIATDRQTADSVVSFARLALTDQAAYAEVANLGANTIEITVNNTGWDIDGSAAGVDFDSFEAAFCESAGIAASDTDAIILKSDNEITVTINKDGLVTSDAADELDSDDLD